MVGHSPARDFFLGGGKKSCVWVDRIKAKPPDEREKVNLNLTIACASRSLSLCPPERFVVVMAAVGTSSGIHAFYSSKIDELEANTHRLGSFLPVMSSCIFSVMHSSLLLIPLSLWNRLLCTRTRVCMSTDVSSMPNDCSCIDAAYGAGGRERENRESPAP